MNRDRENDRTEDRMRLPSPTCADDLGIVTLHPVCIAWVIAINLVAAAAIWLLFA